MVHEKVMVLPHDKGEKRSQISVCLLALINSTSMGKLNQASLQCLEQPPTQGIQPQNLEKLHKNYRLLAKDPFSKEGNA